MMHNLTTIIVAMSMAALATAADAKTAKKQPDANGNVTRQCEPPNRIKETEMTEAQIKHMVDRFLNWRLPKPWHPDNGISYTRPNYAHPPAAHDWPVGTNLFDADQATAMVRHMIDDMPDKDKGA